MSDNSNINSTNNQSLIPELQKRNDDLEASFKPFEFKDINSQDQNSQKQIKIVPKKGSSISELRITLKHAMEVLDGMQNNNRGNETNSNLERSLNNLTPVDNNNISRPEQFSKQRAYKIFRKRKFVPYRKGAENSQDRTRNAHRYFGNLNILNHNIYSDEDHSSIDLDQLANSLGFHLEVSDQETVNEGEDEREEVQSRKVDVSDFISTDSQGNRLFLGDRMKMLEQLIIIAEGDLNNLAQTQQKESSIIIDE